MKKVIRSFIGLVAIAAIILASNSIYKAYDRNIKISKCINNLQDKIGFEPALNYCTCMIDLGVCEQKTNNQLLLIVIECAEDTEYKFPFLAEGRM